MHKIQHAHISALNKGIILYSVPLLNPVFFLYSIAMAIFPQHSTKTFLRIFALFMRWGFTYVTQASFAFVTVPVSTARVPGLQACDASPWPSLPFTSMAFWCMKVPPRSTCFITQPSCKVCRSRA